MALEAAWKRRERAPFDETNTDLMELEKKIDPISTSSTDTCFTLG
jgi:hypothetical protein